MGIFRLLAILSLLAGAGILAWYLGVERFGERLATHPLALVAEGTHFATDFIEIRAETAEVELLLMARWSAVLETRELLGHPPFTVVDQGRGVVLEGTAPLQRTQTSPGTKTLHFALGRLSPDPGHRYRLIAMIAPDSVPHDIKLSLDVRKPGKAVTPLILAGAGLLVVGLAGLFVTRP